MIRYLARYSAMATMTSADRAAHAALARNSAEATVWATHFDKCDATHARLIAKRDARRLLTECQMPAWECNLLRPANMTCATHSS